jgi:pimeloyl-ACP methyl ester carboxylesterase
MKPFLRTPSGEQSSGNLRRIAPIKQSFPYGCLLSVLLGAVCVADDFRITHIAHPQSGGIQLNWTNNIFSDGYRLQYTTNLVEGFWHTAGQPDDWPRSKTVWSGSAEFPNACFRIQNISRGELQQATFLEEWFAGSRYCSDFYKLTYTTFDHRGTASTASGLLAVPTESLTFPYHPISTPVPVVCYQHGTIFLKNSAPSQSGSIFDLYAQTLASDGYAVLMTDYPGLGDSPVLHPYLHARSEATSAIDLLRAGLDYMTNSLSLSWNGQLFLMGYSQGGHATLALQKELQIYHSNEFFVTASAPMAGPHDLSGTMSDQLLSDQTFQVPSFIPYLVFGLNTIYDFYEDPSKWLKEPYATDLPPLFDGQHTALEINAAMTNRPKYIFTEELISDFETNPQNLLRKALRTNDTSTGWVPAVPTRLYHCAGDTTVPKANSRIAVSNFWAAGASTNLVSLYDPSPTANHVTGEQPCFDAAKAWFDTLRE